MKFENHEWQVSNLELSKHLKELGYPQKGLWWWVSVRNGEPELYWEEQLGMLECNSPHAYKRICVAPTCAELGEKLPFEVDKKAKKYNFHLIKNEDSFGCSYRYYEITGTEWLYSTCENTLANTMTKMLIYSLENKLIKL